MGNFSKPPRQVLLTNLERGYVGLHIEQGVPVLDRDLNLVNDLISATIRSVISRYIGNGVAADTDGFAIQAIPADNDFRVTGPGRCLVGGFEVTVETDINYSDQTGVPALTMPIATQPDPREDLVYLDVWLAEVSGSDDADLLNSDDVGMQTSVRLRPTWLVLVAEGKPIPDPDPGHTHYPLARIERDRDVDEIQESMITDLRQTILTLTDVERRLSFLEKVTLRPSFAPSPNQFTPKMGWAGQNVTLLGNNFNVGTLRVQFSSVDATIVGTPTADQIITQVPTMSTGGVNITVTTDGGTVVSDDIFTVISLPLPVFAHSPNQFTPKLGAPGTEVTLFGSNFDVGIPQVQFGSVDATIVGTPTADRIITQVPTMSTGGVNITVTTDGGTVVSDDTFTVV